MLLYLSLLHDNKILIGVDLHLIKKVILSYGSKGYKILGDNPLVTFFQIKDYMYLIKLTKM